MKFPTIIENSDLY